ncbi:hypothetical protein OIU84_028788 [Salix udensis]|uniref:Uncharacterized protein n=1 Tax=Salix udensis TaxID=889485 RepID=A0AAD6P9Q1_9ROSI|nr:hypothetical protein OIU84_028788 [Salix udensis]
MATKVLPPKQLQNLHFFIARSLTTSSSSSKTSSAVSPLNLAEKPETPIQEPPTVIQDHAKPSILDFNDHQKLFSNFPTTKLLRASSNLHMVSIGPLVDFGKRVMNSRIMETDNIVRDVVLEAVKAYVL